MECRLQFLCSPVSQNLDIPREQSTGKFRNELSRSRPVVFDIRYKISVCGVAFRTSSDLLDS